MKALPVLLFPIALAIGACGDPEAEVVCEAATPRCDRASYFPLCAPPEDNEEVRELDGLFCSYPGVGEPGLVYIGEPLEFAPACSSGQVTMCPSGEPPECYYLAGCPQNLF